MSALLVELSREWNSFSIQMQFKKKLRQHFFQAVETIYSKNVDLVNKKEKVIFILTISIYICL